MKIIKSVVAIVLAICLCLVLVACGGTDDTKTTTTAAKTTATVSEAVTGDVTVTSNNSNATTVSTKKTTAPAAGTLPHGVVTSATDSLIKRTTNSKGNASASFVKSLKGYKLKVFYPWTPESKGSIKELKESALESIKAVENEYGVTITEDGKFANYNETLTANLTSKNAECQVYMVQNFNYASYFKNNYMTDLTQAMTTSGVDFKDPWYVDGINGFFNVNYKQYAWIAYDAEYVFPQLIIYNKSLIKKAKLTDPVVLAEQGKWTWDTMIKYAKKLTTTNVIGFGCGSTSMMLETMCKQKGTALTSVSKGKSPSSNISNQTVKDCLSTLYTWCKNNQTVNTFSNHDWTYGKTQFAAGKVAMIFAGHDTIQSLRTNKKTTDDFGLVQFATPTGTKSYTNVADAQFPCFIPSQYKADAAKILFLRNEMYRYNYRYAQKNFTYQWDTYFPDADVLEYACNIKYGRSGNKTTFSWASVCENNSGKATTSTIINYVLNNNGAVQTAIDKYKTALDKEYTKVWDGYRITGNV